MSAIEAIVLGIIQGLTEFLPISSSGHLRIVPAFLGWEDPGAAFTAVIQLGTMAAELVYFRKDLWSMATGLVRGAFNPEARRDGGFRMGTYLIVGTIPIGVLGFLFRDLIETEARSLYLIGTTLVVLGVILWIADKKGRRDRDLDTLGMRDAVTLGFAQSLALIPGVSRSGATISGGLFLGFDRATAARFSFLLSIPAVVISGLFELRHIGDAGAPGFAVTGLSAVLAFGIGYFCIAGLLRFLTHHTVGVFVAYRVVLGSIVLTLTATGVIS